MEDVKKVKAELVKDKKQSRFSKKVKLYLYRIKLAFAILFDIVDFFIAWIPIVNTLWDIVTFIFLLIVLKNKSFAFFSLIELPLIGLPPFSIIDMFIPVATLTVMIDNSPQNVRVYRMK